jgi:TetR/AcrR family transcriptional repressor of nem operon
LADTTTRDRILQTAIGMMQRRGFRAAGMRDIAQAVQVKAPSLYHHFASKDVLVQEAMAAYTDVQAERLAALDTHGDVKDRLLGYVELFAGMLADGPRLCLYAVLSEAHGELTAPCVQAMRRFEEQNLRWLERTLQDLPPRGGRADRLAPAECAELIFGAFEGYMVQAMTHAEPAERFRRLAGMLLEVLGVS